MPVKLKRRDLKKVGITLPHSPRTPKPKNDPRLFIELCLANGLPTPVPEFPFSATRKWKFDWAWPRYEYDETPVALEIEGLHGRHQMIGGFLKDMAKYREAAIMGWCVIRVTWKEVNDGTAFDLVKRALGLK